MQLVDKNWIFTNLKYSLQALAVTAEVQQELYPSTVVVPDEPALDFDNFYKAAISNFPDDFSSTARALLDEIDHLLLIMSEDKSCWDIAALQLNDQWGKLRIVAASCLNSMNWIVARPPYCFAGPRVT